MSANIEPAPMGAYAQEALGKIQTASRRGTRVGLAIMRSLKENLITDEEAVTLRAAALARRNELLGHAANVQIRELSPIESGAEKLPYDDISEPPTVLHDNAE